MRDKNIVHGIETVSYTHLDVYKRQGQVSVTDRQDLNTLEKLS
ncbi:hypothetical protein AZ041_001322, partial [Escherichia coli]